MARTSKTAAKARPKSTGTAKKPPKKQARKPAKRPAPRAPRGGEAASGVLEGEMKSVIRNAWLNRP